MPVQEILVHVSGASTSKDDDRYRRMAEAYEEYEFGQKISMGTVTMSSQMAENVSTPVPTASFDLEYHYKLQNPEPGRESTTEPRQNRPPQSAMKGNSSAIPTAMFIDNTQAAGAYLESQLFTSSLQALSDASDSGSASLDDDSPFLPTAQCASSPPPRTILSPSCTPKVYPSSLKPSTSIPTPLAAQMLSSTTHGLIVPKLKTAYLEQPASPASVELLTQTPPPKRAHAKFEGFEARTPKAILNAQIATSSTLSAPSNVSAEAALRLEDIFPVEQTVVNEILAIQNEIPPIISPTIPSKRRKPLHEVFPPPPPTLVPAAWSSTSVTHSYITPSLRQLADTLSLSTRFRPSLSTRPLRIPERGCWLVETDEWDPTLRREFWEYLSDFVADGRAGWGVTCFRDEEEAKAEASDEGSAMRLGLVRVYCWGEVVGHVYLLLFVASKSKIKRTGARWIDAGGKMVVRMP